jgi:peptidoglycan/LPS O-acetylase OafA/YrhL
MKRTEIGALTGLRGVAAIWVLLFHICKILLVLGLWPELTQMLWNIAGPGYIGVDMFFVLSGFVLAYNYPSVSLNTEYLLFLRKRLARIYPVHVTVLIVAALLAGFLWLFGLRSWQPDQFKLVDLLANLTLTQSWFGAPLESWNLVSWSISAEWFAYLAFPIVLVVARSLKGVSAAVTAIMALYLVWFLALRLYSGTAWAPMPLLRVGIEFASGVCVYQIWARHEPASSERVGWFCVGIALAIVIAGRILEGHNPGTSIGYLPVLMPALIWSLTFNHPISRLLATPFAKYLGYISYSLYMVHWLLILAIADILGSLHMAPKLNAVLLLILIPTVSIFAAMILYEYVEEPMRRYIGIAHRTQPMIAKAQQH